MKMNDDQLQTLEQIREYIGGSQPVEFQGINTREKYTWKEGVLKRFRYQVLRKDGKGMITISAKSYRLYAHWAMHISKSWAEIALKR
jgi:hypothetical protein